MVYSSIISLLSEGFLQRQNRLNIAVDLCVGVVMICGALVGLPGVVNCGDRGQAPDIVAGVKGYSSVSLEAVGKLVAVGTWRKNDGHCMKDIVSI